MYGILVFQGDRTEGGNCKRCRLSGGSRATAENARMTRMLQKYRRNHCFAQTGVCCTGYASRW